jgi:nucleotide-binding universal stress UspA family protein
MGKQDQAKVIEATRRLFAEIGAESGITVIEGDAGPTGDAPSATWRQATGPMAETVVEEARLADVAVIAQASDGSGAMSQVIEAVLFGSGRPLLLAPLPEPASIGTAVAVAWDGSSAASRAVAAALPFLQAADRVSILAGEVSGPNRAADPQRLVEYLAMHGVASTVHGIEVHGRAVGKALVETARTLGCDLLVMGAYGHSRVREMVLGGVTLGMLEQPQPIPILMAH